MILVCVVFTNAVGQLALAGFMHYLTRLQFVILDWTWAKAKAKHVNTHN